jgi:hypothetical protein
MPSLAQNWERQCHTSQSHRPRFVTLAAPIILANQPKQSGVVLYPGFQLTDVRSPVDVINVVSSHIQGIQLSMIAESISPVSTSPKC